MNQPYVLGGLAVLFYAGCMLLNPWSNRFRRGWQFTREWPLTWLVLGIVGAHQGWWLERKEKLLFGWPEDFTPAFATRVLTRKEKFRSSENVLSQTEIS